MVERRVLLVILISIAVAASGLVLYYYMSLPRAVGTITGTVTQVGGIPIEGATVTAGTTSTTTNSTGGYVLPDLPEGRYTVTVTFGTVTVQKEVEVLGDQEVVVNFEVALPGRPSLLSWFNNKTGDDDRMFLVEPGETVVFTVEAANVTRFEWEINKLLVQNSTNRSFTFTVPDEKDIWEIHLTIVGTEGKIHHEWVVSTLTEDEAPTFFDYFVDAKYMNRTELDPWGRPLPEWTPSEGYSPMKVSKCFLEPTGTGSQLEAASTAAYGTWIITFKSPTGYFIPPRGGAGPRTQIYYYFIIGPTDIYFYNKETGGHNYFGRYYVPTEAGGAHQFDRDAGFKITRGWYKLTIIRTPDGWFYAYITDIDVGKTYLQFRGRDTEGNVSSSIKINIAKPLTKYGLFPQVTMYVDCFTIYKNRYLFPEKSAVYRQYVHNYQWRQEPREDPRQSYLYTYWEYLKDSTNIQYRRWYNRELNWMKGKNHYWPIYKNGIVVNGRNVTLADIARMVNDPSLFSYDPDTRTAVCYTNLVLDEGAELIIKNETLKMHCNSPGEHEFAVLYGSTLRILDSTVTSDNGNYFTWRFSGTTHFGYYLGAETCGVDNINYVSFSSITIENSIINNSAYMFLDAPLELTIRNSKIINLHQVDTGDYSAPSGEPLERKMFVKGAKAFWVFIKNYKIREFNIDNVTFSAAPGEGPVDYTFILNCKNNKLNVYNSDFGDGRIVARKSVKMGSFWAEEWPTYYPCKLGLVNCRFDPENLIIGSDDASIIVKYYLDVKVVDENGQPVEGANVTVINEVDQENYPPENLVIQPINSTRKKGAFLYLYEGFPIECTVTGIDGHTPLPSNRTGTIIITDYVLDESGKREFTYTIIVTAPDGRTVTITGVNPDSTWYRPDPNIPTYTITVVLKSSES